MNASRVLMLLTLLVVAPARGLSIYDVIQLSQARYTDQQIIELIDSTQSAFELAAGDVTRLKDLGVSETVIRKMLGTAASLDGLAAAQPQDVTRRSETTAERTDTTEAPGHTHAPPALPARDVLVDMTPFAVQAHEEAWAGAHRHAMILIDGVPLLVLRDEGGYATIEARAHALVSRLAAAAREPDGWFSRAGSGSATTITFSGTDDGATTVLEVSERDAVAYRRRSGRVTLSVAELADYWSKLLNDYWSLVFRGEPPRTLTALHESDGLKLLYELLAAPAEGADAGPGRLGRAAAEMPNSVRDHLFALAASVPDDFRAEVPR